MMIVSYKLRLQPTREQRRALEAIVEQQRVLYNAALEERILAWEKGVSISVFDQGKSLTIIRNDDPAFAGVQRRIQAHTLDRLDRAYKAFFRRAKAGAGASSGFPRFRGRDYADSFGFNAPLQIKWDGKRFRFSGVPGGLRAAKRDRQRLPLMIANPKGGGTWKGVQFRRVGQIWWATVQIETPELHAQPSRSKEPVGVDWGTSALAVLSTGKTEPPLSPRADASRELLKAERKVARAKKGSKRRRKARTHKQAIERRIANRRRNRLDKFSKILVTQRPLVAVEIIDVQRMTRSAKPTDATPAAITRRRNREALESAPYMLRQMIAYKGQMYGCEVLQVPAAYTTQTCSACDALAGTTMADKMHTCGCGAKMPRKVNSARVILKRALEAKASGNGAGRGPTGAEKSANGSNGRRRPRNTSAGNSADGSRPEESGFHIAHGERGGKG